MIQFINVTKTFPDGTSAVENLNLTIKEGEFFVLIGPSGCGKTTTLKMMNRLIDCTKGTITIGNKEITKYDVNELRWNIGYVLQQTGLFPHMTNGENIAIVPELKKWKKVKIQNRVNELLNMIGLDPKVYRNRKPKELSGGQQQRIGVARALAADPTIILMDEPFSALDPISREKLQDDMIDLQRKIKKTIVFVTHDMNEALKLGDRICVMKEGKAIQIGTPEELIKNPVNHFVKDFVGSQNDRTNDSFNLKNIIHQPSNGLFTNLEDAISVDHSLQDTLAYLTANEQLPVEEDGEIIGMINRQIIIEYLAGKLDERGRGNE
ncbi:ABC transporter ATP-binding protein [Peribacillus huizhouensis]|uniref:Osmoprotectant transport system ATP-binding protein n=1 Tax=Peribacillus huizhouensis TaxID=1501239 RepID=A0ABR6CR46_9BACI|nr:ABC transporter ATP-binding protein [Peribacillus huizhouensis]MBA9027118.1 osmoprotectant transport system ATP-binding protein [Peribacillus huizhouensis]